MPETAQQFREFVALAEDPDVVPSMHTTAIPFCDSSSGGLTPRFVLCGHACGAQADRQTNRHGGKTLIHKINLKKIIRWSQQDGSGGESAFFAGLVTRV